MSRSEVFEGLQLVVEAFEALGVRYHVAGSVASSAYGLARSTLDVDVVADLQPAAVERFTAQLKPDFYIDEVTVREAVAARRPFNVIHLKTMLKIDIFILSDRPFDRQSFRRSRPDHLSTDPTERAFQIEQPEDVVLHKLEWFVAGGQASQRQWGDVLGILKVQQDDLDWAYLLHWSNELGLEELLRKAAAESGQTRFLPNPNS